MAGLFTQLSAKLFFEGREEFRDSLNFHRISSLAVDIGNEDVWSISAHIMIMQPDLRELCIMGNLSFHNTLEFCWSGLAKRFAEFRGTSVVFRKAAFGRTSVHALACIGGQKTVNSLTFERSILSFERHTLPCPFFPLLERIKYIRSSFDTPFEHTEYIFSELFMTDCQLTHFETSFGLLLEDELLGCHGPELKSKLKDSTLKWIYTALCNFSLQSLQVFLDVDSGTDTFIDLIGHWSLRLWRHRPSFHKMKVVIIKLESIRKLLDETPCTLDQNLWSCRQVHHHSVWRYLSLRYASFPCCDCVIVETGPHAYPDTHYASLWKLTTERLLNCSYRSVGKIGEFRYFIVGNSTHGYRGIERNMQLGCRIDKGKVGWEYREIDTEACLRVLRERGFPPGKWT